MSETLFKNGKLPNVKVKVKPIFRKDGLADIGHEANFLFGSANWKVTLPLSRSGKNMLVNPFNSEEEKEFLENKLGVPLNPYGKDSYFRDYTITLDKSVKTLDLSDPVQYLNFLILSANKSTIRPLNSDYGSREQKYKMVTEDFETAKTAKKANNMFEAYARYGEMRNSKIKLRNFLRAFGKRVTNQPLEWMQAEVQKIINDDIDGFLKIVDNPKYEKIVFIEDAWHCGAIVKKDGKYTTVDGDQLAFDGKVNNLEGAIEYLFADENQQLYLIIKDRIENAE